MKDIRIFVASSKELVAERNALAYLALSKAEEFEARGFRVRLAKWEYVDPKMTAARTEDRYLDEMYNCDAALVLFRNVAGMYTREELDKALAAEKAGTRRLKTHEILFAADGAPDSDAARLRASLPGDAYGVWSGADELRERFLALVDRIAAMDGLVDAPSGASVRKITAFLASDEELADERDAFADTVLNVNDLLEQAHRNLRIAFRFYDPARAEGVVEASEMGLVLYGTNCRVFGREEIERTYARVKDAALNPKRFYVFFHDLDEATEKTLDEAFRTFRNDFVAKLGHFTCQFGDANALRLSFLLSLERYAGESVELYSTVTAPTAPVFAGRENEMRRLCGLLEPVPGQFPAGRLPVVTGAGGTGKSELVRQFASQLRVQYPGGVFQVDMEHARTWDDVFLSILNGVPNNGVKVADYLDLQIGEEGGEKAPPTAAEIRNALLRKARTSGPILLVLDNVESFEELFGDGSTLVKAFPAGFSERVRVNVVATARTCDVPFNTTDWAVPFPLGDLSPDAALEVLLKDKPTAHETEIAAAKRTAELLGCRALYLRRVPAILNGVNKKSRVACRSYAALAELLEKDPLLTIRRTATVNEEYLPTRLWALVRNNLAEWGLGEACIKLARIASFFSPDGFPMHILRHLWNELVFPRFEDWGSQEEVFDQAFELLKQYNLLQSDDPVRMHRLDRAAILADLGDERGGLEEAIGKALAGCPTASQDTWLSLAEFPDIVRYAPNTIANGDFYAWLLSVNPALGPLCPWGKLDGKAWSSLLRSQPQFASRCTWEKLDGNDWSWLLGGQPQFADRCTWDKFNGNDWSSLLREQPQFADRCTWDKFNGNDWEKLLGEQPQFADKCPWEKLDGEDWARLLAMQPQFANRCPWEKLNSWDWACLLGDQPQFAGRCPWDKFNASNWSMLLHNQPQFADRCPWNKFNARDWSLLLGGQPQFADRCPWDKFNGNDWSWLLGGFKGSEAQPQFADRCPWEKLDGEDWSWLLGGRPQFADRCQWDKFNGNDWSSLLRDQPQFADRCPWDKFNGSDWEELLCGQPQFADRCQWDKLDTWDWACLLGERPQFADRCPWEKLDGEAWSSLLGSQPQFADRCPWEKLDGKDWARLLGEQAQFADRCPWDKLDGSDWAGLLECEPRFADRCDWSKLSDEDWAWLLEAQPQFADRRGKMK